MQRASLMGTVVAVYGICHTNFDGLCNLIQYADLEHLRVVERGTKIGKYGGKTQIQVPILADSLESLSTILAKQSKIGSTETKLVAFVIAPLTKIEATNIEVPNKIEITSDVSAVEPLTASGIRQLLRIKHEAPFKLIKNTRNTISKVLADNYEHTFMSDFQTLLYRIPKQVRDSVRNNFLGFISGSHTKKDLLKALDKTTETARLNFLALIETTGACLVKTAYFEVWPKIDKTVTVVHETNAALVKAVAEKYRVASFDINYLLVRQFNAKANKK